MIYVPLKHLRPGLVLAKDVATEASFFSLLTEGQILTPMTIRRLKEHHIRGVYIRDRLCGDLEIQNPIDTELKRQTITELKHVYTKYLSQRPMAPHALREMSSIVEDIVGQLLTQDECLFNVIDIKDYDVYTYTHSMNVGVLSVLIGMKQGLSRSVLTDLALCGLLHDIGKQDVPLEITNKNTVLTCDEFEIMKRHPRYGVNRLRPCILATPAVLAGIGSHHEKMDGTGYPNKLQGENIPLFGRILALADVYDALTSARSYRVAWTPNEAVEYIMGYSGTHFDENLVELFIQTIAVYPVGSIIRLSNQSLAIVIKDSKKNVLRPIIRLLTPEKSVGKEYDLCEELLNVTILGTLEEDQALPEGLFL